MIPVLLRFCSLRWHDFVNNRIASESVMTSICDLRQNRARFSDEGQEHFRVSSDIQMDWLRNKFRALTTRSRAVLLCFQVVSLRVFTSWWSKWATCFVWLLYVERKPRSERKWSVVEFYNFWNLYDYQQLVFVWLWNFDARTGCLLLVAWTRICNESIRIASRRCVRWFRCVSQISSFH